MKLKKRDVSLLGNIFEQLDKALIVLDEQFIIKYINNVAAELINTDKHIIGLPFQDILLKSNIPFQLNDNEKIIFSKPIKINDSIKKLKTHSGSVDKESAYFILDQDVTEQEKTLQLLETSTQNITGQFYKERLSVQQYLDETIGFLEKIIKQMPCFVYWKDKDFRYLYCNDLTAQLMGLNSVDEVKGKTDYDFGWDQSLVDAFRETDIRIMTTGKAVSNLTEDLIDKNGRVYHTLVNKLPIKNEAGTIIGILGITVDITEIQEMQIALQKAKEAAEVANIAKTEFIANMSHDIRTPLTGVIGLSQLLEHSLQNDEDKEKAHLLHDSGAELLHMINEILDDVRVGNLQEKDIKKELFDIYQCVNDLIRLELPTTTIKNLELKTDISPDVPRYLLSDRNKIHRILLNLLGNSIKFTQKGSITIAIECLHKEKSKVHLKFSVSDTGIGIPKEAQSQVFNRFFKVSSSYKGIYTGHGLGLYIVQSYVTLLGGQIALTSKEGQGSTFYFDLVCELGVPPKEHLPSVLSQKTTIEKSLSSLHLLLVEDNAIALKTLEYLLSEKGYTFHSTTSGEEALILFQEHSFDLIITDIGLPDITGLELSRRIRSQSAVPIITLSGHAGNDNYSDFGISEVFSKPIQIEVLHECIQKLVNQYSQSLNNDSSNNPQKTSLGLDLPDTENELFQLSHLPLFDEDLALKQIPDRSLLINMLHTYVSETVQQEIHLLEKYYKQQDWVNVEKIAHKIKGGVVYLGTPKIGFACQYFERYYKAGHRTLLEPLYQQLINVNEETTNYIEQWLRQQSI